MNSTDQNKLKRALWLAFKASAPMGLGFLHAANAAQLTEDSLFAGTYKGGNAINTDYVCGRMMKTRFVITDDGSLVITPDVPRGDYQSWAFEYPTAAALVKATEDSLKETQAA